MTGLVRDERRQPLVERRRLDLDLGCGDVRGSLS